MFGVNEYYESLLLEAKSPEEIKKILEYQFIQGKGVPESIFYTVFNTDPTKKKAYTRWLLSKWDDEKEDILKIVKDNTIKRLFEYFQERNNNGLNLASFRTVKDAVGMLPEVDRVLTKNGNGGPEDDYDIVYDSPEWKIAVPHTYEASEKLGEGCRWCTAGAFRNGESYFYDYTNRGHLWINFDMREPEISPTNNKEYPYTRYQFCFETGDWRNSDDEMIESFSSIGIPEGAIEFYRNVDESYGETIDKDETLDDEARYDEYIEARDENSYNVKEYNEQYLSMLPEWDDDYVLEPNAPYYLYDEEDTVDPICYNRMDPHNYEVKNFEHSSPILIKDADGIEIMCFLADYWECVTGITKWQVFDDKYLVFTGEKSNDNLYFYDLEKNTINSVSGLFGDLTPSNFYFTHGLPINSATAKGKKYYDIENVYIEIDFSYSGKCKKSLIKYDKATGQLNVIVSMDSPNGEHFAIEFKKDDNGVEHPYVTSTETNYGFGYMSFGYSYSRKIDNNNILVSIKAGYDKKYNIFSISKDKLLFEEPAIRFLKIEYDFFLYQGDNYCFAFKLSSGERITDVYRDYYAIKYGDKNLICFKNNANAIVYNTLMEPLATFNNVCYFNETKKLVGVIDKSNTRVLYDIKGSFICNDFDSMQDVEHTNLIMVTKNKVSRLIDTKQLKIVETGIVSSEENGYVYCFKKEDSSVLFVPITYYTHETDKFFRADKLILKGINTYLVQIQNRYFFFGNYNFFPEQGIDINEIKSIDNIGNDYNIVTKNGIKLIVKASVVDKCSLMNNQYRENEVEYNRLFKTGLMEVKNKFYDIYNKIKYVWVE